jgi:hypothetical protein
MSWQMAVVGALGAATIQQQGAYGKFNQAVQNRNAKVAEQEAEIINSKLELDLATFNKKVEQLQGQTRVAQSKSGIVTGEGTGRRIELANLAEAEIERSKLKYDAEIGKSRAFEQANFSRIQGQVVRQEARVAQLRTATQTGTSLLSMQG